MSKIQFTLFSFALVPLLSACRQDHASTGVYVEDIEVVPVEQEAYPLPYTQADNFQKGDKVLTNTGLNLRTQPSTRGKVRAIMPEDETVRVVGTASKQGWYNINFDGIVGWASGKHLRLGKRPVGAVQEATARALSAWGFSYHWGGGDWDPTSQEPGRCGGSYPDFTHEGDNGADCSGLVAKVWQVPESNAPTTKPGHPYSTKHFKDIPQGVLWNAISSTQVKECDAMVWRNACDSAGHIFYVYGLDAWGAYQAVECKDCATGCLYNIRSADGYSAIRRHGF